MQIERFRKRTELSLQLSPGSIQGIIFSTGNRGISSSQFNQGQHMKIHKNAQLRRRIQAKQQAKPIQTSDLGQNTTVGAIQAQPKTHQSKAVASGLAQVAVTPQVWAHRPQLSLAPPCSGSAFNARGGCCMCWFPKIHQQPIILKLKKEAPLHI